MSYKLFLSFSLEEADLAEHIRNTLNNAFRGKISFFFSRDNILGGVEWKSEIKRALLDCDAALTILTPSYLERPWAYIEWSAFWLKEKTTYIIVTDDVEFKDIVDPMKDSQSTELFSEIDARKLLESLATNSSSSYTPYECIPELVNKSRAIYQKLKDAKENNKYSIYLEAYNLLPEDDLEKIKILWYYHEKKFDPDTFVGVFNKIHDNSIKGNVLCKLLGKGELDLIERTFELVESKNNLLPLLKKLIENGYEDTILLEKILDYVASSQTSIRSFGEFFSTKWIYRK